MSAFEHYTLELQEGSGHGRLETAKRFCRKDERSILSRRDSHRRKNISTVPNSGIDYGSGIQGSERLPAKYESSKSSPKRRVPVSTISLTSPRPSSALLG